MVFGREDVSETDAHHGATMQFSLGEISATGSVDPFYDFTIERIAGVASDKSKTNHWHHDRRSELKLFVRLNPLDKKIC